MKERGVEKCKDLMWRESSKNVNHNRTQTERMNEVGFLFLRRCRCKLLLQVSFRVSKLSFQVELDLFIIESIGNFVTFEQNCKKTA